MTSFWSTSPAARASLAAKTTATAEAAQTSSRALLARLETRDETRDESRDESREIGYHQHQVDELGDMKMDLAKAVASQSWQVGQSV